jgi:hypothetical protein
VNRAGVAALLLAMGLVLAGCSGERTEDISGGCGLTSTDLHVIARNTQFDPTCLAMIPNTTFNIIFENHDPGVPHSISIYSVDPSKSSDAKLLFEGDRLQGPGITTYKVPGLPAGFHFFRCEVHPTVMFGQLQVEG